MVVNTKELIRQERKSKKGGFLKSLLFLALIIITIYILIQSPLFMVKRINTEGNKFLTSEEIIKLSGIHTETNIFKIDFRNAMKKIKTHPMISNVVLKRQYPDQIKISIVERRPLANMLVQGGFIEVNEKGFYLRKLKSFNISDNLPIISGVKYSKQEIGQQINEENLLVGLEYLKDFSIGLRDKISEINVEDPNNIIIYSMSGFRIMVGDETGIKEKIHNLNEIFNAKGEKLKDIEYIDVSFKGDPVIKFNNINITQNKSNEYNDLKD